VGRGDETGGFDQSFRFSWSHGIGSSQRDVQVKALKVI
jgi:hypothetical protein